MNKQELRTKHLKLRANLSKEIIKEKSLKITKNLESLNVFTKANKILFYYSFNNEVETLDVIKKYLKTKNIFLPKIIDKENFTIHEINSLSNLKINNIGIMEPDENNDNQKNNIDLIIIPGVCFDKSGNRIGMGRGYYDRFLKMIRKGIPKIALGFEEQLVDNIPKNEYDVSVDFVITDKKIYNCNQ